MFDQLFEATHLLRLAAQVIVEPQHLDDQAGTKLKRQLCASCRGSPGGGLRDHVAFEGRQPPGGTGEPTMKTVVQLLARDEGAAIMCERAPQLARSAARGNHDDCRLQIGDCRFSRLSRFKGRDRAAEFVEVRDADQPRPARGNHRLPS